MARYHQARYRHSSVQSNSSRYDGRRYSRDVTPSVHDGASPQPTKSLKKQPTKQPKVTKSDVPAAAAKQPPIIQDVARPADYVSPNKKSAASPVAKPKPERSNVLQRSLVDKPSKLKPERPFQSPKRKAQSSLFVLPKISWRMAAGAFSVFAVFGFIGAGAAFLMNGATHNGSSVLSEQAEPKTYDQQPERYIEEEVTVADIDGHSVGEEEPAIVRIPGMGVKSRIFAGGVDASRQIILPENIFDVTWYQGSRVPHQPGTVILNGHVSGSSERGAFYYLRILEHGDIIEVESGDGTTYEYEVVDSDTIAHDQLDVFELLAPYNDSEHALHLVAVDTRYNVVNNDYQDRLIVYAVRR